MEGCLNHRTFQTKSVNASYHFRSAFCTSLYQSCSQSSAASRSKLARVLFDATAFTKTSAAEFSLNRFIANGGPIGEHRARRTSAAVTPYRIRGSFSSFSFEGRSSPLLLISSRNVSLHISTLTLSPHRVRGRLQTSRSTIEREYSDTISLGHCSLSNSSREGGGRRGTNPAARATSIANACEKYEPSTRIGDVGYDIEESSCLPVNRRMRGNVLVSSKMLSNDRSNGT